MTESRFVDEGRHVTVQAWELAVELRDGALVASRGPGRYRRSSRGRFFVVDARVTRLTLAPQEVLTLDGLTVRLTATLELKVTDARRWLLAESDGHAAVYARVQLLLRDRIAALTAEQVIAARATLFDGALEELAPTLVELGAEASNLALRDLGLPQELRQAYSATAVAAQEGRAQLERARGEAAALRSLANTARLIDDNPALLSLRALQSAGYGSQLVLHLGEGAEAKPASGKGGGADEKPAPKAASSHAAQ